MSTTAESRTVERRSESSLSRGPDRLIGTVVRVGVSKGSPRILIYLPPTPPQGNSCQRIQCRQSKQSSSEKLWGILMFTRKLVNQCQSKEKVKFREWDEKPIPIKYVAIKEPEKTVCSYRLCVVVLMRKSSVLVPHVKL
ncbi:hypothetical protein BHM03_00048462 [Ensete ventricosum]|nr:hypothetical protein BHM03_00048462 [Ensete ventricosum]